MKPQRGAAMVEFAIIALLFFMILFGIIEFGRAFFTYNTLVEATRRAARVAAVCPANDTGIATVQQVAIFNASPATNKTSGLLGLTPANVVVRYLSSSMTTIAATDGTTTSIPTKDTLNNSNNYLYDDVAFVQVQITNFQQVLNIPLFTRVFPVPAILTTLPSESLGRMSSINPPERCCYGVVCSP